MDSPWQQTDQVQRTAHHLRDLVKRQAGAQLTLLGRPRHRRGPQVSETSSTYLENYAFKKVCFRGYFTYICILF